MSKDDSERFALLQRLCETTQDAVILIDRLGIISYFNASAEAMFGYKREEILGKPVTELMPEPHRSEHHKYIDRYESTGVKNAIGVIRPLVAQRRSGERFPMELSVTEVGTGSAVRYGAFIRDVSERQSLRQQLVERERLAAIGTTAATLAHEVGNPLNNMLLSLQLLSRSLGDGIEDDEREAVDSLSREMARLKELLVEFRALARRQTLHPEQIDLVPLVNDTVRGQSALLSRAGVTLECELPTSVPIHADALKLTQLLINLCHNAVEAMPDGGVLGVSVAARTGRVRIDIADTGLGVSEAIDIFEPFQTTKDDGTGLGLAVARRIALAHGGTISHKPNEPRGTVFSVTLPLRGPSLAIPDSHT